ncbi:hypothetical protein H4R26_000937 [Coemansia thaxteri]|uniref:NADH dehydrogenase [ubiquinone] 1 alpha subcomplex subunit n=1 Tax=Coemansia thaxteri TaxID=2663907 RepID=A0A9W8BLQ2_9FUNG|nr:hypothetical protein H4R26_000937 [Coemansia thaxteri]KAJ2486830.1 hypothetical protein EV174_000885 [Coemansia sp. RSA 2320]
MGLIRQAYLQWKALRLPWRKDVLAGTDLDGNLYFERAARAAQRTRRHVLYRKNISVADYTDQLIPVQWQAWMRHTRSHPPTITELLSDVERRQRLAESVLARSASKQSPPPAIPKGSSPAATTFEPERWEPATASRPGPDPSNKGNQK